MTHMTYRGIWQQQVSNRRSLIKRIHNYTHSDTSLHTDLHAHTVLYDYTNLIAL